MSIESVIEKLVLVDHWKPATIEAVRVEMFGVPSEDPCVPFILRLIDAHQKRADELAKAWNQTQQVIAEGKQRAREQRQLEKKGKST
jgi:hypothetical protein